MNEITWPLILLCIVITILLITSLSKSNTSMWLLIAAIFLWTVAIEEMRIERCQNKIVKTEPELVK